MPARRNKRLSATAKPAQEKPVEEKEKQPVVTQVVEVIDEEAPSHEEIPVAEPEPAPASTEDMEEGTMTSMGGEPQSETGEFPSRKSMVEELYTEKKEPSVMPEISMHRNDSKKSLAVWAIVTIVVALLTGFILFGVSKKGVSVSSFFVKPTPTPTAMPTTTPTPTPATVDKSSFEIQVLNGGGTPGAASKMKKFLEDKGYTVASTGNTDAYTYDTTEIHGKEAMQDAVATLKADLKDTYTLGTVATDLDASASASVHVIVGKE